MKFKLYKFPPLIEVITESIYLHCDNPACGYDEPIGFPVGEMSSHINDPCPVCKLNILTQEDYDLYLKMTNGVRILNKYFSWIQIFWFWKISKKRGENYEMIRYHGHHNEVKLTKQDKLKTN